MKAKDRNKSATEHRIFTTNRKADRDRTKTEREWKWTKKCGEHASESVKHNSGGGEKWCESGRRRNRQINRPKKEERSIFFWVFFGKSFVFTHFRVYSLFFL